MNPNESEPEKEEMSYLIVDDDLLYAQLVADAIGAKGVRIAGSMREAIDMIDRRPPNYVLLDLSLPDSRPERTMALINDIKTRARGATVIVITGYGSSTFKLSAIELGADMFIEKGSGDKFFKELVARLSRGRAGPCASRETVEKIEQTVASMTGTELTPPPLSMRHTVRFLSEMAPLLR
jgi:ActR/RegA family two-component response regulator